VFYISNRGKLDSRVQVSEDYRRLYKSVNLIQEVWTSGLRDNVKDYLTLCPEEKNNSQKCSITLLECLSHSNGFKKDHGELLIKKELVTKTSMDDSNFPFNDSVHLDLSSNEVGLSLFLENSCREIYLPQRMYALENTTSRKYSWWDNFGRFFFLEKNIVNIGDVRKWLEYDTEYKQGDEILKSIDSKLSDESPALNLKYEEMLRYCSFRGKQLLSTTLFDAASMHPGDFSTDRMKFPLRSIWPWDYKKRTGVVWEHRSGKKNEVENDDCRKIFSSECLNKEKKIDRSGVHTWAGMRSVLGGEFETFRNPVYPKRNLKVSSKYYKMTSKWHELGSRAYWDGNGFSIHNFNFRFEDPSEKFNNFGVAFRCAREVIQ